MMRIYFDLQKLNSNFQGEWVQMRKYQACVFYMPILLRICRSESTREMEKDSDELRKLKCDNQHLLLNFGNLKKIIGF